MAEESLFRRPESPARDAGALDTRAAADQGGTLAILSIPRVPTSIPLSAGGIAVTTKVRSADTLRRQLHSPSQMWPEGPELWQHGPVVIVPTQLEPHGERRRSQLIAVAAHIIVTRGVDAVTHAFVAELAGVTRPLVYRYFSRREDLLYAVMKAHQDHQDLYLDPSEIPRAVVLYRDVKGNRMTPELRAFLNNLWRPEDWTHEHLELRLAVIILIRDQRLGSAIGEHEQKHRAGFDAHLIEPLLGIGLTRLQTGVVLDALLSAQHHVTAAAWAGEISRDETIEFLFRASVRMVQAFLR